MARQGYKIFDADTHLYEPVEQIEAYLSAADRAKLDALAPLVTRTQVEPGMSRYRIGERPPNDRRLGSEERVRPAAFTRICRWLRIGFGSIRSGECAGS